MYVVFWLCKFLKGCKCASSEGDSKGRKLSASGGPPPGALPLDPDGGSAPRPPLPRIRSRSARSPCVGAVVPQLKIPGATTGLASRRRCVLGFNRRQQRKSPKLSNNNKGRWYGIWLLYAYWESLFATKGSIKDKKQHTHTHKKQWEKT